MGTVLSFRGKSGARPTETKNDTVDARPRQDRGRLRVVSTVLPTGERLPVLVDDATWLPLSMALRWVIYDRRYACAESTLRRDVNGLRYLYAWGHRRFAEGIEARLAAAPLTHDELVDLRGFLLDPKGMVAGDIGGADRVVTATGAAGARALSVKLFLVWAVSPAARNERGADPDKATTVVKQIEGVLGPLAGRAGKGRQRVLIENDRLDQIEALLRPEMDDTGRFHQPLRWHADNPFRPALRVRNWLMWCIARDSGLRIGEILTLSATATHAVAGHLHIVVRRAAHRGDDPRARAPNSKTKARTVPMSAHAQFALQAYSRGTGPAARRRGSAYLITSLRGTPLTHNPADRIMRHLGRITGVPISWHALRHAWATDFARAVLLGVHDGTHDADRNPEAMKALLIEQLRELGGWSLQSTMPMYYAGVAIKEDADRLLSARQAERAARIVAMQRQQRAGQFDTHLQAENDQW